MPVTPSSTAALATLVAGAAVSLSLTAAGAEPAYGVRVGIDGAVSSDTDRLADLVTGEIEAAGRPVGRVRRRDFLRPRSLRLELGPDPDAEWERWYDDGGLRREVLDPMGPDAAGSATALTWLPALWDAGRDRAVRASRVPAAPGTVLVASGPYLLRWELADAFDLVVHLDTSAAAMTRRSDPPDVLRVVTGWRRYLDETAPGERASYVVRLEDPRHPALVTA